jgi:hypothetical protein
MNNKLAIKTIAPVMLCSVLLLGCSQEYETQEMRWDTSSLLYTNQTLTVFGSSMISTNVDSLDQAANIIGKFGWELVNTEAVNGETVYHMKRKAQRNGEFALTPNIIPITH